MGPEGLGEAVVNLLIFAVVFVGFIVTLAVLAWQGRRKRRRTQPVTRTADEALEEDVPTELVASSRGHRGANAYRR